MKKYIQLTDAGYLHLISDDEQVMKTKCGKNARPYDYRLYEESDPRLRRYALCHKCQGKRREGPQSIREAFGGQSYEPRRGRRDS